MKLKTKKPARLLATTYAPVAARATPRLQGLNKQKTACDIDGGIDGADERNEPVMLERYEGTNGKKFRKEKRESAAPDIAAPRPLFACLPP